MLLSMPMMQLSRAQSLSDAQAFALAALFHLALLAAVFFAAYQPRQDIVPPRPIEVRLIETVKPTLAPIQTPVPTLTPPKQLPKPVVHKTVETPKPLAATAPVVQPAPSAPSVPASEASDPTPAPLIDAKFDAGYLNNPKPIYPPAARRRGETGTVFLRVHVSDAGRALAVEIKASSGSDSLDRSALDTVAKWKFIAASKGGQSVSSWVIVPIKFSLNED
jgi:protein TonB